MIVKRTYQPTNLLLLLLAAVFVVSSCTPKQTSLTGETSEKTEVTEAKKTEVKKTEVKKVTASFLREEEKAMVDEINLLRANPAGYIPFVEEYIKEIKAGKTFSKSPAAAEELVAELRKTGPLSTLEASQCIYTAAKKHGEESVRIGSSDHVGQDGSWPWDRVLRSCSDMTDGNENLVGGPDNIRRSMMLLLVDDGISTRGHRKTLLEPKWKYVACYKSGTVGIMKNSWIQMFGV